MLNDLKKVPVVRVLFPFLIGISVSILIPPELSSRGLIIILIFFSLLLFFSAAFIQIHFGVLHLLFGTSVIGIFATAGIFLSQYDAFRLSDYQEGRKVYISGRIIGEAIPKEKNLVVNVAIEFIKSDSLICYTKENIQIYVKKDSSIKKFLPGEKWVFRGKLSEIRNKGNPGEFDYKSYMLRRKFHYRLYIPSLEYCQRINSSKNLKFLPARVKQLIASKWDQSDPGTSVLAALTLGDKSHLSRETKKSFARAGAMHLLAVSGLHVGMIWWILDMIFYFPVRARFWKISKLLLIAGILWFYAGVTGFSDSVTRSVTMFTLVAVSKSLGRKSNIFNTLLLSCLLLLISKPARLVEPGFQLSYIAVFGIVTLQPIFSRLYETSKGILKYFFDLISVSMAAQISTLPLTLLYFNQFSVWFLLSNIFAIPLVSLILALFVLFSPLLIFIPECDLFSTLLLKLVHVLMYGIDRIAGLPGAVIRDISMSPQLSIIMLISMSIIMLFLVYREFKILFLAILVVAANILYSSYIRWKGLSQRSFEIYNFYSTTVVSFLNFGDRTTYFMNAREQEDPYVEDFFHSLNRIPFKVKEHRLFDLNEERSLPSKCTFQLSTGAWSILAGDKAILLIANCRLEELISLLSNYNWDILIFKKNYTCRMEIKKYVGEETIIIGDGTLSDFEIGTLEEIFPDAYILEHNGFFRIEYR